MPSLKYPLGILSLLCAFCIANIFMFASMYFLSNTKDSMLKRQSYIIHPSIIKNITNSQINKQMSSNDEIENYDFTLISQTSISRLFYIPYMQNQWKGSVVITIYMTKEDMTLYNAYLEITAIYPQLLLIPYLVADTSKEYPINKLRNISIRHIKTSHFWIADMDMWPTKHTYAALLSLPSYLLRDPYLAIIVPAFSFSPQSQLLNCPSHKQCVDLVSPYLPGNQAQLEKCIQEGKCQKFRPESETHDYVNDEWFHLREGQQITFLRCINILQEPYVALKKTDTMPYFDERFYNYGYNKIQYIDHLKFIGYKFALLSHEFAFDIPHPSSKFAQQWTEQWQNSDVEMQRIYKDFLRELPEKYEEKRVVYTCTKKSHLKTVRVQPKATQKSVNQNIQQQVQSQKIKHAIRATRKKRSVHYLKKVQPAQSNLYKTT